MLDIICAIPELTNIVDTSLIPDKLNAIIGHVEHLKIGCDFNNRLQEWTLLKKKISTSGCFMLDFPKFHVTLRCFILIRN